MNKDASDRFSKFLDWLFYGGLIFSATQITSSMDKMQENISSLAASVSTQSADMRVMVERSVKHESQLQRQDERIRDLERDRK
ncbi:hypothetical protein [Bdellovibrio bacteriovorus]|uniref:hypothetical protein n=1 Tax=Bdellovibrio bacteriovorus TaxID=959 RepID=UPI003AA8745F